MGSKSETVRKMTTMEMAYIAKYYEYAGPVEIGLALDRCFRTVHYAYERMVKNGTVEYWQSIWNGNDINKPGRR